MRTPYWWHHHTLIAIILWPCSLLWRLASTLRAITATPEKLSIPVWCVGNATAGGGGKTPFCIHLATLAKAAGINAYFISRGYGGSLQGPVLVDESHNYSHVGDEALLLARHLPTVVCHQRIKAAKHAESLGAQLLIMDDGMQYPHLHKDKQFMLLKGERPFGNGWLIPAGPLREPVSTAYSRSNVVVQIDASHYEPETSLPVFKASTSIAIPALEAKSVVAFAGIAFPGKFKHDLITQGLDVVAFYPFADHHPYSEKQVADLHEVAKQHHAVLITTAKDFVRIPDSQKENILTATHTLTCEQDTKLISMLEELRR